jgi:hypothetical protein
MRSTGGTPPTGPARPPSAVGSPNAGGASPSGSVSPRPGSGRRGAGGGSALAARPFPADLASALDCRARPGWEPVRAGSPGCGSPRSCGSGCCGSPGSCGSGCFVAPGCCGSGCFVAPGCCGSGCFVAPGSCGSACFVAPGSGRGSPTRNERPNSWVSSSPAERAAGRPGGRGGDDLGAGAGRVTGSSRRSSGVVSGSTCRTLGQCVRARQHNQGMSCPCRFHRRAWRPDSAASMAAHPVHFRGEFAWPQDRRSAPR